MSGDIPGPPRWSRLYAKHCPTNTDPWSRHAKLIAEAMRHKRSPLRTAISDFFPDHKAHSIEVTVRNLWEARAEIERLKAQIPSLSKGKQP